MFFSMIFNDIRKNKATTGILILFVLLSSMLISSAISLSANLASAMKELMTNAKTPHVMQMHAGELDYERLSEFASNHELVDEFQVVTQWNVEASNIFIEETSLLGSVQDNAFVVQNKLFDYLLNLKGEIINVLPGEIYVPVYYWKQEKMQVGDKIHIKTNDKTIEFFVAGALRDSQMNAAAASSKRFLIHESDYKTLTKLIGTPEYLIEFRLTDISKCGEFETDYINAGLEANGQMLTYRLYQMLNALSEGIMIAVILLTSIVIVFIAFLCIRFILLATIEEDYREIGIMKALGMYEKEIKTLYVGKYRLIAGVGCLLGGVASIALNKVLLQNIRMYMGESSHTGLSILFCVFGCYMMYQLIVLYVKKVVKKINNISAVTAIRVGNQANENRSHGMIGVIDNKFLPVNAFLGIKDLWARKKLYRILFLIFTLAAFLMIVPMNLSSTLQSEGFITYFGVGTCDMRIDVQQVGDITEKLESMKETLKKDTDIEKVAIYKTAAFEAFGNDGTIQNIKVEVGNHQVFPLEYISGSAPKKSNEIALSALNAKEFEKKVGDFLVLLEKGEEKRLRVCGIYQDVTNGGKTAKAVFDLGNHSVMWYVINTTFAKGVNVVEKIELYRSEFSYAKISSINEYIKQTLGGMMDSLKQATVITSILSIGILILITVLFIKMLLLKDRHLIAIMKAIGFANEDIRKQYTTRFLTIMGIGVVCGMILSNTLGLQVAEMILSQIGITSFHFIANPMLIYVVSPLLLISSVVVATLMSVTRVKTIKVISYLRGV